MKKEVKTGKRLWLKFILGLLVLLALVALLEFNKREIIASDFLSKVSEIKISTLADQGYFIPLILLFIIISLIIILLRRSKLKRVLSDINDLLEDLPENKIKTFVNSGKAKEYKEIMKSYGVKSGTS